MIRIAFFGTPSFAADILEGISYFPEIEVVFAVSQPDMPVGRKQELLPTAVKTQAQKMKIQIFQPLSLKKNNEFEEILRREKLDFIVVVAYGKIIPHSILDIPKYGCINIHGSILPKYRGASPVQECLRHGDTETGLTTMYMSQKMDEGDILQIAKIKVDILDKSPDIFKKFVQIGPNLLRETLNKIVLGEIESLPQDHLKASYCSKIEKEDGKISFQRQSATEIYNLFRAYTPWPGIFTDYKGKKFILEEIFLGDSSHDIPGTFIRIENKKYGIVCADRKILLVSQVKGEGKKSLNILSFINGNKDLLGYKFD